MSLDNILMLGQGAKPTTDQSKIENGGDQHDIVPYIQGMWHPENNQWVGPITPSMLSDIGNPMTFGIGPPGLIGDLMTLLILKAAVNLSKTAHGQTILKDVAVKYLDTCSHLVTSLHASNASNPITAAMNNRFACSVYERIGLISPHNATTDRAWFDHLIGEQLLTDRAIAVMQQVSTWVSQTNYQTSESKGEKGISLGESGAGLGAIAKILGGVVP